MSHFTVSARKSPVHGKTAQLFRSLPHGYLIVNRDFTIVDVNTAYALLTLTDPEIIIGRGIFDVFPDNPGDPAANGVRNLSASLHKVLAQKENDRMLWQRYDIRDRGGSFIERHWDPINCPILDDNGEVEFIVHHVSDVTKLATRLRGFRDT
jgi:PAS domain-containing protein